MTHPPLLTTKNSQPTTPYTGRLAPSPTGLLHLGHARTFWIAYERARHGKLWLRDEDLDPHRSRADFATAMREDLHWLGIEWHEEAKQSERLPLYRDAMQRLLATGLVYPCHCSRRDLERAVQAPHEDDDEPIYRGTCRPQHSGPWTLGPEPSLNYRFRVPDNERITFTDLHFGPQTFRCGTDDHAAFGDFLVWRKASSSDPQDAGLPSYQLACAVDDAAMAITEVVRGRDLLKSTARQILLQRALGLPTPDYFHCDLMRDPSGIRLAKRHDALSLRTLSASGLTPEQIRSQF
jgi:glutamyl/glutaminyl-tRNA synthetase